MKISSYDDPDRPESRREATTPPDFSHFDSVDDLLRDVAQWGRIDELRDRLLGVRDGGPQKAMQMARDIAFELAGAKNRALAVDVLIYATGIAEFSNWTLRDYAAHHAVSHEWFRRQVIAMRRRLNIPQPVALEKGLDNAA